LVAGLAAVNVIPFPDGMEPVERHEVSGEVDVALWPDGCGGLIVYEPEPDPTTGRLKVVTAPALEVEQLEALARAALAVAAELRRRQTQ
jgi:hypothetical protein